MTSQLEDLFAGLSRLSTLPVLAAQIIDDASDPLVDVSRLVSLIERDPVLAARLLRVANSSFYGQRQGVDTIERAVLLLGRSAVASQALTIIVGRQFRGQLTRGGFERERLWIHSIAVAAVARLLASELKVCDHEQAYLAGLLHDYGLIVIDQQLHRHVPRILRASERLGTLTEAVASVLPFTPAELSAYLIRKSMLPETLAIAIETHEFADQSELDCPLADIVAVADYLASRYGASVLRQMRPVPPSDATMQKLELTAEFVRHVWPLVESQIVAAQAIADL